jgi:HAD superfamily phosphatase (TIGR01668 family)
MFLTAQWQCSNVMAMPLAQLQAFGIRGFIFDLDNTLIGPSTKQLTVAMAAYLKQLQAMGFKCCVVSNNKNQKYLRQAEAQLGMPVLGPAHKPSRKLLRTALAWLQLPASQVAVVGDRPLTDTWAANRMDCPHVLVDPLEKATEHAIKRFLRQLERLPVRRA